MHGFIYAMAVAAQAYSCRRSYSSISKARTQWDALFACLRSLKARNTVVVYGLYDVAMQLMNQLRKKKMHKTLV
ncbi:hypothetical protein DCAR_0729355 [Daucus carota subsp. sativus]|uniref:Uncharacterized protein n=1 Tax=Daucus carota subsp. sativus TaxID=79200 RepID=A0A161X7S1_DAUCS|nr:hypothetical protein DCAR_0729355 [Daucus carota subsp. sativus]